MSNPYYIGTSGFNPSAYAQPMQNYPFSGYNFVGKYVKSYDEVKNAPFEDKTCIYLDTEHDRIYIKEITRDGVPNINVLGLVDIQNVPMPAPEQPTEPIAPSITIEEVEKIVMNATKDIVDKFEKRIKTLEDKVQKNF